MRSFLTGLLLAAVLAGGTVALYDYAAVTAVEGYDRNPAVHVDDASQEEGVSH